MILAIDPGPIQSALVICDQEGIVRFGKYTNDEVLVLVESSKRRCNRLVIEMIQSFGMPVGAEVFETCVWIGRFMQAFGAERVDRLNRPAIKTHLCATPRAKDANVRQALIDRFGGKSATRKGGALYGISGDVWSALAVAVTWWDNGRANG